jgi:hypothetical protein
VAVAEGGIRGEVREYGRIANTPAALDRLAGKLGRDGVKLRFCYEAGPCGYGIQRHSAAFAVARSRHLGRRSCLLRATQLRNCSSASPIRCCLRGSVPRLGCRPRTRRNGRPFAWPRRVRGAAARARPALANGDRNFRRHSGTGIAIPTRITATGMSTRKRTMAGKL